MILSWATIIAVLGRMRPAGHGLDYPALQQLGHVNYLHLIEFLNYNRNTFGYLLSYFFLSFCYY